MDGGFGFKERPRPEVVEQITSECTVEQVAEILRSRGKDGAAKTIEELGHLKSPQLFDHALKEQILRGVLTDTEVTAIFDVLVKNASASAVE